LPPQVLSLARTLVRDPVQITIAPESPTVERIAQKVLFVDKENKDALLVKLLRESSIARALVFIQRKHAANKIAKRIASAGIEATVIHGNKSQGARTEALASFKAGRVRVLVATDIAARGLDVDGITHVINYELPIEPETYVHRIGRTGRAESDGMAISFCSAAERESLNAIEVLIRKRIPVDTHEYHSESARNARGAAARPSPGGRRGSSSDRAGRPHHGAPARGRHRASRSPRRSAGRSGR
jgi:ATP-dependent RNA helicase RhlE